MQDNDIEMYSAHNKGKSVVSERFVKTLKNKIYTYTTSLSVNVYIDKLDKIVNKYKNTYLSTIKMKPTEVKSRKILNLKLVIILEYQNINKFLQKVTLQIYLKKFGWGRVEIRGTSKCLR